MSHCRLSMIALPVAVGVAVSACAHPAPRAGADAEAVSAAPGSDPTTRDVDIAFDEKRLREDPESAADRSRLGPGGLRSWDNGRPAPTDAFAWIGQRLGSGRRPARSGLPAVAVRSVVKRRVWTVNILRGATNDLEFTVKSFG